MAKWKEISKLSAKDESARAAAFEAAMMAELAQTKASQPQKPAPALASQPTITTPAADSIAITVTENGKSTTYPNLASVPVPLRQRIVNAWLASR